MRLLFLPIIHVMIDATEPELATRAMYHYPRDRHILFIFFMQLRYVLCIINQ